jgi:hypothetical protein
MPVTQNTPPRARRVSRKRRLNVKSGALLFGLLPIMAIWAGTQTANPSNDAPPPGLDPAYPPGMGGQPPGQAGRTPPGQVTGTITIAGGAAYTRDANVSLGLTYSANADWVYVTNSPDCVTGGTWQAVTPALSSWTLGQLNTTATVYAVFRRGGQLSGGGSESACVSDTIIHDNIPPAVEITFGPADPTNQTSATVEFTAGDGAPSCSVDGAAFAPCTSPLTLSELGEGTHSVTVQAVDAAGNVGSASYSWTVDVTPPAVAIISGPANPTNQTTATLAFIASDGAVSCSLDGAAFAPCGSPVSHSGLTEGQHSFTVQATDAAGNIGSATHSWTVDVTPPSVAIVSGPIGPTNQTTAALQFTASDGALTCSLDGAAFAPCASPAAYAGLGQGTHTFTVRATDTAGNAGSASYSWTVDLTPPVVIITARPSDPATETTAAFSFMASDGATACSLDGAAFTPCSSPIHYSDLAEGSHTFTVRAIDAAGNAGAATATWTIEAPTPPPANDKPPMAASATYVPSDGLAYGTIMVTPRMSDGAPIGTGLHVEVTTDDPQVTLGGTGTAECAVPSTSCRKAFDSGAGSYVVTARRSSAAAAPSVFSAVFRDAWGTTITIDQTVSMTFDSNKFLGGPNCAAPCGATISANTAITSAYAGGRNLYIKGGTVTFDASTADKAFGDIFISGGTVTHLKGTSSAYYRIDVAAGSWNLLGGTVDTTDKGYGKTCFPDGSCQGGNGKLSFGPNGAPSAALAGTDDNFGGSHGGMGNGNYQQISSGASNTHFGYAGPTYGDYRDPKYPGATNSSYSAFHGGGVTRVVSSRPCVLAGASKILATSPFNGAGGSVNLRCAGIVSAGWTGEISADGGRGSGSSLPIGAGGGGRIALVSSGDAATITGAVSYPPANITARVHAYGGAPGTGSYNTIGGGGAGTLYIKHSGLKYGDLIVANNSPAHYRNEGTTRLPSIAGTLSAAVAQGATSVGVSIASTSYNATYYDNSGAPAITSPSLQQITTPSNTSAYTGVFPGIWVRPDITAAGGSLVEGANLLQVSANTAGTLTTSPAAAAVPAGAFFRSIDVLDHLDVTGNAILETNGDIHVLSGNVNGHDGSSMTVRGLVLFDTTSGRLGKIEYAQGPVNIVQATQAMPPVAGGTLVADNVTITGGSIMVPAMIVSNAVTVSGGGLTTNSLTAVSYTQTSGTLSHYPPVFKTSAIQAVTYALEVNLTGPFTLSGGMIDVSVRGYPVAFDPQGTAKYVFSYGLNGPATAAGATIGKGGSHGGVGGNYSAGAVAGMAYDDYRNPRYPGGGGAAVPASSCSYCSREGPGGGVVRIATPDTCTLGSNASIRADAFGYIAAGGSVYLGCGAFQTTGWSGNITANGGIADRGSTTFLGPGAAGGGGRIAIVSSGGASSFSGTLSYPMPVGTAVLQARGGAGVSAAYTDGGAGTVFLKHAGVWYGQLIVNNNNTTHYANGGYTPFVSIAGTLNGAVAAGATTIGVTITTQPAFGSAALNGVLAGVWIRPDANAADIVAVSGNTFVSGTLTNLTTTPAPYAVTSGTSFWSVDAFDVYDVGGGAIVKTTGEIYVP